MATQEVEPAGSANGESSAEPSAQLSAKQRKKARQKNEACGQAGAELDRDGDYPSGARAAKPR